MLLQVDSKYDAGQYAEAARASRIALILNIIAMVVGFVLAITVTIIVPIVVYSVVASSY